MFADYIIQQNRKVHAHSRQVIESFYTHNESQEGDLTAPPHFYLYSLKPVNLKSVLIGNGMTHPYVQYGAYYTAACTNETGYGPFVAPEVCERMASHLPRCLQLMKKCAENLEDSITCLSASTYCEKTQTEPFYDTGRNAYDMEKFGEYDEEAWMAHFLNQKSTMHTLGVDLESHGRVKKHTGCDPTVGYRFSSTGDGYAATFTCISCSQLTIFFDQCSSIVPACCEHSRKWRCRLALCWRQGLHLQLEGTKASYDHLRKCPSSNLTSSLFVTPGQSKVA